MICIAHILANKINNFLTSQALAHCNMELPQINQVRRLLIAFVLFLLATLVLSFPFESPGKLYIISLCFLIELETMF